MARDIDADAIAERVIERLRHAAEYAITFLLAFGILMWWLYS